LGILTRALERAASAAGRAKAAIKSIFVSKPVGREEVRVGLAESNYLARQARSISGARGRVEANKPKQEFHPEKLSKPVSPPKNPSESASGHRAMSDSEFASIEHLLEPENVNSRQLAVIERTDLKDLGPKKIKPGQAESQVLRKQAGKLVFGRKLREIQSGKKKHAGRWKIIEEPVSQATDIFKPAGGKPRPTLGKAEVEALRRKAGVITEERRSRGESAGWQGPEPTRRLTPAEHDSIKGLFEPSRSRPRITEELINPRGSFAGTQKTPFVRNLRKAVSKLVSERDTASRDRAWMRKKPVVSVVKPKDVARGGTPAEDLEKQSAGTGEKQEKRGAPMQKLLPGQTQVLRLPSASQPMPGRKTLGSKESSKDILCRIYSECGLSANAADRDHYLVKNMAHGPREDFALRIAEHLYRKTNKAVVFPHLGSFISYRRKLGEAKSSVKSKLRFGRHQNDTDRRDAHNAFARIQPRLEREFDGQWEDFRKNKLSPEQNRNLDDIFAFQDAVYEEKNGTVAANSNSERSIPFMPKPGKPGELTRV